MKNFLKNVIKSLAVSALMIAFYTPQTSCMKEKIKNAKAKIQHDLDNIENRLKHVIPTLANSKLWTKLCTYACITATRLIQDVGQPKPLKVSLLEKDEKDDQLYLAKLSKRENKELIVPSSSELKYIIVPLIILNFLFIVLPPVAQDQPETQVSMSQDQQAQATQFNPITPPIYPICHPQTDGTEFCCQYQFNSLIVTCFIQNPLTGQELARGSIDPLEWKIVNNYEVSSQKGVIESEEGCSFSNQTIFQESPKNIDQHLDFIMNEPSYKAFIQYVEKLVEKTCGYNFTIEIDKNEEKAFLVAPKKTITVMPQESYRISTDFTNYAINIPKIQEVIRLTTEDLQATIGHEIGHVLFGIYNFPDRLILLNHIDRRSLPKIYLQRVLERENTESTADTVSALITQSPLSLASCFIKKGNRNNLPLCLDTAILGNIVNSRSKLRRDQHPPDFHRIVHMVALHEALPHLKSQLKEQAKRGH